ncbi:hypothetical protein [Actinomadura sp. WMMA1423]|uniref:hypothetical protein n=1 Tax=Actinomadura sp. WMMA1423 TaxID=2591108 RepID=UPI00143D53F1|nr:hypothetical protein [Actinomadura sp. WMMA1423]
MTQKIPEADRHQVLQELARSRLAGTSNTRRTKETLRQLAPHWGAKERKARWENYLEVAAQYFAVMDNRTDQTPVRDIFGASFELREAADGLLAPDGRPTW